jgi:hypothetical protein
MANNAIGHNVKLTVEGGNYYITVDFKGLAIEDSFGYLSKLFYFDPVAYDSYGNPTGTAKAAAVLSYQTNADGSYVVDRYNDATRPYPDLLKFPLVNKTAYEGNYVPLQVFVPIMEAISTGSGTQDVLMRLDWMTLKSATDEDFKEATDKAVLTAKVTEANAVAQGNKSDEAYAALKSAIATAISILGKPDATQAEVESALAVLQDAIAKFTGSADVSKTPIDADLNKTPDDADHNKTPDDTDLNKTPADADLNKAPVTEVVTDLSAAKISAADKVWTGKKIASGFELSLGGKNLAAGADYTIAGTGANTFIGQGAVSIKGAGNYSGETNVTFRILPKAVKVTSAKAGKKSLAIRWTKAPSAEKITKYEVRWKQKGAKSWKSKTVSAKSLTLKAGKLKKNKKYDVQARVYKTVKGVKYYSAWSAVKTSPKVK